MLQEKYKISDNDKKSVSYLYPNNDENNKITPLKYYFMVSNELLISGYIRDNIDSNTTLNNDVAKIICDFHENTTNPNSIHNHSHIHCISDHHHINNTTNNTQQCP